MGKKSNKSSVPTKNCSYRIHDNTIIFSNNFNKPLDEYYTIINKYKFLAFENDYSSKFNRHITIPMNLTSIAFSNKFNKPVVLTPNLTNVVFNGNFNSSIELSKKLKSLHLGYDFNKPINLSKYLMHLSLVTNEYSYPVIINKYMNKLILGPNNNFENLCILPKNLHKLNSTTEIITCLKLPKNMKNLTLFFSILDGQIFLPKNITKLSLFFVSSNTSINLTPRIKVLYLHLEKDSTKKIILEKPVDLLRLEGYITSVCDNLPNGMRQIEAYYNDNFHCAELPNSMRIIHFKGPHCENDIKTPKNITVIRNNNIYDVSN